MSSPKVSKESMKMVPVRSFNDFLLDAKRYQTPAVGDLKRLNNRITSNLLYYQTNYFGVSALVFILFLAFGLNKMVSGAFGIVTTVAVILFQLDKIPQASSIRAQYPIAPIALGVLNLVSIYLTFRAVLFFALAILVPIAFWIIHAATRCRGLKNRINNKMEQIGAPIYKDSPMGFVLASLGLETKDFEE